MVKQSRVTSGCVFGAPTQDNALLQPKASKKARNVATRLRGLGRASGVFAIGLSAAFAAPRDAKALPIFTDNSAYSLNQTVEVAGSTTATTTSQPCSDTGDPGCWTNFMSLVDIDGDGTLDLLEANGGGLFGTGLPEESVVYQNDGKASFYDLTGPTASSSFGSPHTQGRVVAAADIDGDGDIDIYQPSGYGTDLDTLFVQTSAGIWADHAATNLPTGLKSHAASAKFGDVDGDGDVDLLVADWGTGQVTDTSRLLLYINDGTGIFTLAESEHDTAAVTAGDLLPPAIPPSSTTGIYGARITDVDFADIDGDYDLDILVNYRQGYSRILLNNGQGKFTDATNFVLTGSVVTSNYPPKVGPYSNNQEVCDIDEDGDLDIILDNAGTPAIGAISGGGSNVSQVLLNDGTGKFVDGTSTTILSEPTADDGIVRCADIDGDGHYDLVVGSKTNQMEKILLNSGSGKFSYVVDAFLTATPDLTLSMAVGDVNGDGKMDVITGQGEGTISTVNAASLRLNRVFLGKGNADTTPPVIRKMQTPAPVVGSPTVFYMEIRDAATSEAGQMATIAVKTVTRAVATTGNAIGTIKTTTKTYPGAWVGGDLFRVSIPATPAGTEIAISTTVTDRNSNVTTVPATTFFALPPTGGAGGGGVEAGAGGEGGSEEAGAGGTVEAGGTGGKAGSGSGGKAGSGGKGGSAPTGEGGEAGVASVAGGSSTGSSDDSGCSISSVPVTKGRGAAMLSFGLAMLGLARRRRNKKSA